MGTGGQVHSHPLAQPMLIIFMEKYPGPRPDWTERKLRMNYEINTGRLIIEKLGEMNPLMSRKGSERHGPFCWGTEC